jgi:hypothetical protein
MARVGQPPGEIARQLRQREREQKIMREMGVKMPPSRLQRLGNKLMKFGRG